MTRPHVDASKLLRIAARVAWDPPPTGHGESITLVDEAKDVKEGEPTVDLEGREYVIRPPQHPPIHSPKRVV